MEFASLVLVACLAFLAGRFAAWPHNVTLYSQLSLWKEEIMATLQQIKDALAAQDVENANLKTALGTLDSKVDTAIAQIEALKASGGATPAELDAVLSGIQGETADVVAVEAVVASTGAKLDAESAAAPAPAPAPAPDDGGTVAHDPTTDPDGHPIAQ